MKNEELLALKLIRNSWLLVCYRTSRVSCGEATKLATRNLNINE